MILTTSKPAADMTEIGPRQMKGCHSSRLSSWFCDSMWISDKYLQCKPFLRASLSSWRTEGFVSCKLRKSHSRGERQRVRRVWADILWVSPHPVLPQPVSKPTAPLPDPPSPGAYVLPTPLGTTRPGWAPWTFAFPYLFPTQPEMPPILSHNNK